MATEFVFQAFSGELSILSQSKSTSELVRETYNVKMF